MKGMKKLDENVIAPYRSLTITNPNLIDNSNWQIGTLKCNPERAGLTYKSDSAGNFSLFDATYILAPNTVTSLIIQDGTIQTIDLSDKCVTNNKIADRTINHMKLQSCFFPCFIIALPLSVIIRYNKRRLYPEGNGNRDS